MNDQIIFSNARIILKDEVILGSVSVNQGIIASIDPGMTSSKVAIDFEGDYLMPGMVEMHTDNFERHLMPRPKVNWAEIPALLAHDAEIASAGITTVFDALGVGDADTENVRGKGWEEVLSALATCDEQDLLRADHYLHVRCELPAPNTVELFKPFIGHPKLSLLSLMDHTPGQRQWEDVEKARTYYTGKKGWSQAKFENQIAHAFKLQEMYCVPHRQYFVDFCQANKIHLASHDDTTIEHVQQAHTEGASMSEFPTTLQAAQTARALGLLNVMGGPNVVRGGSHSGNVAASDLARHDLLDIISSDYVPGSLISAVSRLVNDEILTLPKAVACVTCNPARATGLTDRGLIQSGLRADLVRMRMISLQTTGPQAIVKTVWKKGQQII
jgi:alpha-D-ribose 1-methylphosphonate 5-triphosphate diphosphatase